MRAAGFTISLGIVCGLLFALAPAAGASMSAFVDGEGVIHLQGDSDDNQVTVRDGDVPEPPNPGYGVSFEEIGDGEVIAGPGCNLDSGITYCGSYTAEDLSIEMGEGDDSIVSAYSSFVHIERMKADFGAGDDAMSGDWFGILLELKGGPGADSLKGNDSNSVIDGGDGNDTLTGVVGLLETFYGGRGNDVIRGSGGSDEIDGGPGNDLLDGGENSDTITGGSGVDRVIGDPPSPRIEGSDTILVKDGEADTVTCGEGEDEVTSDSKDKFSDGSCELVNGGPGGQGGDAKVKIGVAGRIDKGRVPVKVTCREASSVRCNGSAGFLVTYRTGGRTRTAGLNGLKFKLARGKSTVLKVKIFPWLIGPLRSATNRRITVTVSLRDGARGTKKARRTSPLRF